MRLSELVAILEQLSPLHWAEDFDNVGLLTGHMAQEVTGVMVCHDALESVIDEAVTASCNVVVCFHPIWFSGLKRLNGSTYVERTIIKAIRHDVAIYALHTALDNAQPGVSSWGAQALGLTQLKVLMPKRQALSKLVTYVPVSDSEQVRQALFAAGAGHIGLYDQCSFRSEGVGSFRPTLGTNPVIGQIGQYEEVVEHRVEVLVEKAKASAVLKALRTAHPYEEVAYELIPLDNDNPALGLGVVGEFAEALSEDAFLNLVKQVFQCGGIRHSAKLGKSIRKVALLGGSGGFAISAARRAGVDAYLTADLKYHQFYEAEGQMLLADIGHFESERFTKNHIAEFLKEKIPNFAIVLSELNTNPIYYF